MVTEKVDHRTASDEATSSQFRQTNMSGQGVSNFVGIRLLSTSSQSFQISSWMVNLNICESTSAGNLPGMSGREERGGESDFVLETSRSGTMRLGQAQKVSNFSFDNDLTSTYVFSAVGFPLHGRKCSWMLDYQPCCRGRGYAIATITQDAG